MSAIDPLDQLRKLAALKDEKIIDEAEFNKHKAELLSRIAGHTTSNQGDSAYEADSRSSAVPPNPRVSASRITPQQVENLSSQLSDCEAHYQQGAAQRDEYAAQLRKLQKKLKYYAFLAKCRKPLQGIVLGPIGPVLILPALGILLGTMLAGMVTSSTSTMLGYGLLMGVASFLFAINAFVYPHDLHITTRIENLREEISRTELALNQMQSEITQCQNTRDELKADYQTLIQQFQSSRNLLLSMDWRTFRGTEFELFLRDVFTQLGFQVDLTKASGDQGVDLLAEKNDLKLAIQAKGYAESVGNAAVQQAHTGMSFYGCNRCVVITNSVFTAAAREVAQKVNCTLIDRSQMGSLILDKIKFI